MRRRSHEIANLRKIVSKDDSTVQLQREIQVMPREERKQLLKEANFEAEIPPDHGLAMKADLCLLWNKLRVLRR